MARLLTQVVANLVEFRALDRQQCVEDHALTRKVGACFHSARGLPVAVKLTQIKLANDVYRILFAENHFLQKGFTGARHPRNQRDSAHGTGDWVLEASLAFSESRRQLNIGGLVEGRQIGVVGRSFDQCWRKMLCLNSFEPSE